MMKKVSFIAFILLLSVVVLTGCLPAKEPVEDSVQQPAGTTEASDTIAPIETTAYTIVDVEKHASKEDCWSVVGGIVYDMSDYIANEDHPPSIVDWCGKDSTEHYDKIHEAGREVLNDYQVGVIK